MDDDGLKDISVTKTIDKTTTDGLIFTLDGTATAFDSTNLASVIGGTSEQHFTDWELPDEMNLSFGQTSTISLSGEEVNQVSSSLQWTSSNEQAVTVSASGSITATGYGKSTITATDGNKISSCTVIIHQNATSISLPDLSTAVGERIPLAPIFYPATATNTELAYTYDTANIVSIDEYGVLHAVAAGTVTVTATTDTDVSTTFTVTVTDPDFIILPGDVNDDTVIDIRDLIRLNKHLAGMITLTGRKFTAADLQEDQILNTLDLVKLRRLLLGIE